MKRRRSRTIGFVLLATLAMPGGSRAWAIQISEIMYHPRIAETHYEFLELHNETSTRLDLGGWRLDGGIFYPFPEGTIIEPGGYLVVALDPATIMGVYGVANVLGPFQGRLGNGSDEVQVIDPAGGVMTAVDYEDDGRWPVAADGAGPSLTKIVMRGDPDNPANWGLSSVFGGTPGRGEAFREDELISNGEVWRYFKGYGEPSSPITAWREVGFDDSSWSTGPTGIGYGDGDDETILLDMQHNYVSVFCRKTFEIADPSAVGFLVLEVDHDDGFVAYLNGIEVGRSAMPGGEVTYSTLAAQHEASSGNEYRLAPTVLDISAYKDALVAGENVLAVQVHNATPWSSDLSFIPRLVDRSHPPDTPIALNEVKFDPPGPQYIELYNRSALSVDVGGFYLSNVAGDLKRFRIPSPTVIPAGGLRAFSESELGFFIDPTEDQVFLTQPAGRAVADARDFKGGPFGMSIGRRSDGADAWFYMNPTSGTANTVDLTTSVVVNEIMYHPLSEEVSDEFIELYNAGAEPVRLDGWRISGGIDFDFPFPTVMEAGAYLVIAKDRERLIALYGLDPSIVLGPYTGRLSDSEERIRVRNEHDNVVDEVFYYDGGRWSRCADGLGSSLELIDPRQDNGNCQSWAPSDEASKSTWTLISYSGVYGPTATEPAPPKRDKLLFLLMGSGEVLIDDVHLTSNTKEYVANGDFEAGLGDWLVLGNHARSSVTTQYAYSGTRSLKIVASGHGNTAPNHVETVAATTMPEGVYTLSFRARWLRGHRVLVTHCFNNQLPRSHQLPIPPRPGTPGAQNSVYRSNLGPVFSAIVHTPAVPTSTAAVSVTARIADPDGIDSAALYFKSDSDSRYDYAGMFDDGLHDDGEANDGLFGGEISPRPSGQTVAFYLEARDRLGESNKWPQDISNPALYRVDDNPLVSVFPTYRIVLSRADDDELISRPRLGNEPLNCTFIFDERDVYYNCWVRLLGSPWHRRDSYPLIFGYKVAFNAEERLHGVKRQARIKTSQWGFRNDRLAQDVLRRMGQPSCPLEWICFRRNDESYSVCEDILPPGRRYLSMYYPESDDGFLFEVNDRFVFYGEDRWDVRQMNYFNATFEWSLPGFESLAGDKGVYRYNYQTRNHENEDNYTSLILMLDALNNVSSSTYDQAVGDIVNTEQWLKCLAVRATLSDWDTLSSYRGKNAYLYWNPATGKWDMIAWDCEAAFVHPRVWHYSGFKPIRRLLYHGNNKHNYLSYIKEVLDKHLNHAALDSWIDHYATQLGMSSEVHKTFIDQRRDFFLSPGSVGRLPTAEARITTYEGKSFTVVEPRVTLRGTAPLEVRQLRINGRVLTPLWTETTWWEVTLPLDPGANLLAIEFLDYDGRSVATDSIVVTYIEIRRPNLAVARFDFAPKVIPSAGNQGITFVGALENSGNISSFPDFRVEFHVSPVDAPPTTGTQLCDGLQINEPIDPGETLNIRWTVEQTYPVVPGVYWVGIVVDTTGTVPESREDDNVSWAVHRKLYIGVQPAGAADWIFYP